ncbi:terminase TerL endonuclease subunit [Peribacillus frigoritolerans]|uniref:terminase TerL endonuclease subunit n=1 Tax=Peribacillus frigoritolerans TaxID=450367 RepID=UPI0024177686|nr:terminase TerL endonuclease subunit [Peribacillus frigoritolerans]MDG4850524.1 terminase large subunit [Peribacillus frigoritolerans]
MNKSVEYAERVLSGEIIAPSQVRKACENFLHEYNVLQHQDGYKYMWNDEIELIIDEIIKQLNFARGAKSAQPMYENLALFQWFLIQNTFCWVFKEFPEKRKVREVIFTVARKNAKSVLSCVIHILAFFLDEGNATHYIGSNTKQQANIIFEELVNIIKSSPNMLPLFNIKKTYVEFIPKNCKIVALSGDAGKADGTMVYVASVDELGASNDIFKMVSSLETGQFGPRNPLIVKISTSYPIENGFNYWNETVEELRKNTFADDRNQRKFGLIFSIDNPKERIQLNGRDAERWENPEVWAESNPLVAELDDLAEKLMEDYKTKKEIPTDFFLFKVKNLNLWMGANEGIGNFFVDQHTLQKSLFKPAGNWEWWKDKRQVIIGLDLSLRVDNTAVTFMWYDQANGHHYVKNLVFYPKDREEYKSSTERIPYAQWARSGYCQAIGEDTVDYDELGKIIIDICRDYNISVGSIAFDSKYSKSLMKKLIDELPMDVDPIKIEQNSRHLGDAISTLQGIVYDGSFHYAPNPLMESAYINGEIEFRQGKPYIRKSDKHRNKIDNLFSSFNAMKVSMFFEQNHLYQTERAFFFEL